MGRHGRSESQIGLKKVVHEIRKEAVRQIRGFPDELRGQVTSGWGREFAKQIFGIPAKRYRRAR